MSVFHFHLRSGSMVFEDRRGVELPTIADAVRHGEHDARHLLLDNPQMDRGSHWIEIADKTGNVIRTVPFTLIH